MALYWEVQNGVLVLKKVDVKLTFYWYSCFLIASQCKCKLLKMAQCSYSMMGNITGFHQSIWRINKNIYFVSQVYTLMHVSSSIWFCTPATDCVKLLIFSLSLEESTKESNFSLIILRRNKSGYSQGVFLGGVWGDFVLAFFFFLFKITRYKCFSSY